VNGRRRGAATNVATGVLDQPDASAGDLPLASLAA
jgi:hypothetical protein